MESRLEKAVEEAQLAFWAEIGKHYPEVKTGDFGPEETFAFDHACEEAVKTWLRWNLHPEPAVGSRWVLRQPVEKYPHFKAMPGMHGTIVSEPSWDYVALHMNVTLPGAEEWNNEIIWNLEDDPDGISAVGAFLRDAELVQETVATHALGEKQAVELKIDGNTVSLAHHTDGDGGHYVKISGVNCDLEGEMPGEYYLKSRAPLDEGPYIVRLAIPNCEGDNPVMAAESLVDQMRGVDPEAWVFVVEDQTTHRRWRVDLADRDPGGIVHPTEVPPEES